MLSSQLQMQGSFLLRWRVFLPLVLAPVVAVSMRDANVLEEQIGDTADDVFEVVCLMVSAAGLVLRWLTVGHVPYPALDTEGRRPKVLITDGMYSVVRHPMYLANLMIVLGLIACIGVWYLAVIAALGLLLYYERIVCAEEAVLRETFGREFLEWSERTPAFFPQWSQWREPRKLFSWKRALFRERSVMLGVVLAFCACDHFDDLIASNQIDLEWQWIIASAVALAAYGVLRLLDKRPAALAGSSSRSSHAAAVFQDIPVSVSPAVIGDWRLGYTFSVRAFFIIAVLLIAFYVWFPLDARRYHAVTGSTEAEVVQSLGPPVADTRQAMIERDDQNFTFRYTGHGGTQFALTFQGGRVAEVRAGPR